MKHLKHLCVWLAALLLAGCAWGQAGEIRWVQGKVYAFNLTVPDNDDSTKPWHCSPVVNGVRTCKVEESTPYGGHIIISPAILTWVDEGWNLVSVCPDKSQTPLPESQDHKFLCLTTPKESK